MDNRDNSEVIKAWPGEKRLTRFQEELMELIKKYDVEPIPTLLQGTSSSTMSFVAQITLIDLQNETMLKKYGREKLPTPPTSPAPGAPEEPPPGNPRLN